MKIEEITAKIYSMAQTEQGAYQTVREHTLIWANEELKKLFEEEKQEGIIGNYYAAGKHLWDLTPLIQAFKSRLLKGGG